MIHTVIVAASVLVLAASSLATPAAATTPGSSLPAEDGFVVPDGYSTLVDDTDHITVAVPDTWTDVDTAETTIDGGRVPYIGASTDRQAYLDTFGVPGVVMIAVPYTADPNTILDDYTNTEGCTGDTIAPYDDGAYAGLQRTWTGCGPAGQADVHSIAASPADRQFTLYVQVQITGPQDDRVLDVILDSFNIVAGATFPLDSATIDTGTIHTGTIEAGTTPPPVPRVQLVDSTEFITVIAPADWSDTVLAPGTRDDGGRRATITAAPDLDRFQEARDEPGLRYVAVLGALDADNVFTNAAYSDDCTDGGREPFDNGRLTGEMQWWLECGDVGARAVLVVAAPADGSFTAVLQLQLTEPGTAVSDMVLGSFGIAPGGVPPDAAPANGSVADNSITPNTVTHDSVPDSAPAPSGTIPAEFLQDAVAPDVITVTDDTEQISVDVPRAWSDHDTEWALNDDRSKRPRLIASTDLGELFDGWEAPGVIFLAFPTTDPAALIDNLGQSTFCTDSGFLPFDNGSVSGLMKIWTECDGTDTRLVTLAVADSNHTLYIEVSVPDDDVTGLQTVLGSVRLL